MSSHHQLGMFGNTVNTEANSSIMKFDKLVNQEEKIEKPVGVIEVHIHQATDIHNICIYQKQDVYAKIYLTNDPKTTFSTKIINSGGQNPVFNETLKLNIQIIDYSSLKCEIWMLSRIQNFLKDQFLGFASIPLCEIVSNGSIEREFSLSSSDLFHSPAGFVRLSIKYSGPLAHFFEFPEKMDIPKSIPCELTEIEFPNLRLEDENECMVSEYIDISNAKLAFTSFQELEKRSEQDIPEKETTQISVSKKSLFAVGKIEDSSDDTMKNMNVLEPKLVEQEIVDMYMKSMHQFSETLAKMNFPLGMNNDKNDDSDGNVKVVKITGKNSHVFYGSRAFF